MIVLLGAQSLFLGCIPMALCTIINGTALIAVPKFGHWAAVLVYVLWWIDVALTLACSFGLPMLIFHIHHVELHSLTALLLLPIVPTVVAAASGGVIAPYIGASEARVVLVVSYMLWGINLVNSFTSSCHPDALDALTTFIKY
jgi:tellurite resistance protein TehA-like permease